MMFAICNPANIGKVRGAILDEVNQLRTKGVSSAELEDAKKAYLEKLKQLRSTDAQLAAELSDCLEVGRTLAYYADLEKKVAALTPEEVTQAFRKNVDPARLVVIEAGDFASKQESRR
jgi:zinc protease